MPRVVLWATALAGLSIVGIAGAFGQAQPAKPTGTVPAGDRPTANQPNVTTPPNTVQPNAAVPSNALPNNAVPNATMPNTAAPNAPAPAATGPTLPAQTTPATQQPTTTTTVGPGKPEPDGKVPKAATVIETTPTAPPANAPADGKPVLSAPVPPAEVLDVKPKVRYFMLIFGAESVPKRGRLTHTWMTIVKATPRKDLIDYTPDGDQSKYYDLLAHTISWMPRSLHIRVIKFRPECGVNLDLMSSIQDCLRKCERIALWGPFEVNPLVAEEVYAATRKQIALLESGRVMYKSLDFEGSAAAWCKNCIHAVSDMDGIGRRLAYREIQHNGWEGSRVIVRYMAGANRIDPSVRHEWVAEALGINKYCISRQQIQVCRPAVITAPAATAQ